MGLEPQGYGSPGTSATGFKATGFKETGFKASTLQRKSGEMAMRRSVLWNGLWLVVRRPGAVVWTYVFNLVLALVFAMRLGEQLGAVLDHSLAASSMNNGFDVGTLMGAILRLNEGVPSGGASGMAGLLLWALVYFLLMPGALVVYQLQAPGKLSSLLMSGVLYFWRTVRIWLLMAVVSAIVLLPLISAQRAWAKHVEEHLTGWIGSRPGRGAEVDPGLYRIRGGHEARHGNLTPVTTAAGEAGGDSAEDAAAAIEPRKSIVLNQAGAVQDLLGPKVKSIGQPGHHSRRPLG